MFEVNLLPSVSEVAAADDAGLIDNIAGAGRFESATMARRLAGIAELYSRRLRAVAAEEQFQWEVDNWDVVAAEVAAALGVSRGRASGLMDVAITLRARLPKVAAVLAEGLVDYRTVLTVVRRTYNVRADDMARVDEALAQRIHTWGALSDAKIVERIDYLVACADYLAPRPTTKAEQDRHVGVGPDSDGLASLWGSLRVADAVALDNRLNQLADSVCRRDPRTKDQRRADATGALAAGHARLVCQCGRADCPVAGADKPVSPAVIHVVAEAATVTGEGDKPGYIAGFGFVDADTVRDLAQTATVREVRHPGEGPAEPQYRPSRALADFVRCRDLTCRFPNCSVPAQLCEIDHVVPWPWGPTHPSNLTLKCKHHHLMKTFYVGVRGWNDRQLPDGTLIWTAPSGHEYTTKPDGTLFFPALAVPTGKLILPTGPPAPSIDKGLQMPLRKRTRAQNKQARIDHERLINYRRIEEPPPF